MGETVSEYMHMVVATIVFASALAFFFAYMGLLSMFNKTEIDDMNTKTSVTMDTQIGYSEPVLYVKGSSVYTDIISQGDHITITLDGTVLDADYLTNLRENNPAYLQDLRAKISMDDDYVIKHEYYSTNEIKAVEYTHS
ncbi:hypothetical protein bpr_IV037 (plasmid) [Butyrivibrio proteoclasticus B316]|uniref:Uncharacterized protein n=1 Tax=Butyrivibrio proteoclasticus (strain ATCC 51982 / DSM 14932 / B316) TaxID=515622 RepID=E0S4S0_BUTPB|nr:hypothetical protein [Butyrivibrio proteoclasticus]ADL36402.1 hypothetical protein bpr_IV037 [Butyrivibrio proteoclasticus B316]